MRILMVDDEMTARMGLRKILAAAGYGELLEATNGAEAYELIKQTQPELIIADIRMPEVDGVELLRLMRSNQYDTPYILLSGYEQFSSAQEALRHNAFAYLLKPVDTGELLDTVRRAQLQLANRRESLRLQEQEEIVERNRFLSDLIFQRRTDEHYIAVRRRELLSGLPYSNYSVAVFRVYQPRGGDPATTELAMLLHSVENIACEMLDGQQVESCGIIEQNDLILLCGLPPLLMANRDDLIKLFHEIKHTCRQRLHPNLLAAVSYITSNLAELHACYRHACRTIDQQITDLAGRDVPSEDDLTLPPEQQDLLADKLAMLDVEGVLAQLSDIYSRFFFDRMTSRRNMERLRAVSLQIVLMLTGLLTDNLIEAELLGDEFTLYQEMAALSGPEEILKWMRHKATVAIGLVAAQSGREQQTLIDQARHHIHQHLGDPLTLEGVAGMVHLSPSYFSRLFKEQTGETFVRYMMLCRVTESKRLLMEPQNTVRDVGTSVGFRDMKHFYKVFKSLTGYTPSEYRNRFRGSRKRGVE